MHQPGKNLLLCRLLSSHPKSNKAGEKRAKELCEGNRRGEDGDANVAEDGTWEGENPKNLIDIFLKPRKPDGPVFFFKIRMYPPT